MAGKPGRSPGFCMTNEHRQKIRVSNIITALQKHALGEIDMKPTQVQAAGILLKKVLPDLSATQLTGKDGGPIETRDVSPREKLLDLVNSISKRERETEANSRTTH